MRALALEPYANFDNVVDSRVQDYCVAPFENPLFLVCIEGDRNIICRHLTSNYFTFTLPTGGWYLSSPPSTPKQHLYKTQHRGQ